jgi:predicted nucleotidyltransferase
MHTTGRDDNPYRRKALKEVKILSAAIRRRFRTQKIVLFGSLARGDVHALSDVDLLIIADFQGSRRDRVEQILDLVQQLNLSFPVEPFPLRPEEFNAARQKPFFLQITREGIEI